MTGLSPEEEIARLEASPDIDEHTKAALIKMARQRLETLHPDLEPYVSEASMGRSLRHPLVYQVPLYLPGEANEAYRIKSKHLAEAIAEQDWHRVIYLHERPYRLDAYLEHIHDLVKEDLDEYQGCAKPRLVSAMLLRDIWIDSENIWQNLAEWQGLLADLPTHEMMLDAEVEALEAMANPEGRIRVWRGGYDTGLSWTTDPDRAMWFAQRFHTGSEERFVWEGEVDAEDVVAYLTGRNEHEIVMPEIDLVTIFDETEIEPRGDD